MLSPGERARITLEVKLGLPPSLTSAEAVQARTAKAAELAEMRAAHIAPEIVFDFFDDELPPLLLPPAARLTEAEMQASKLNLIRASLGSSWEAGLRMAEEARELAEKKAQCCLALEARIKAQPSWNLSDREAFLREIATLLEQGRISSYHARSARWVLRLAMGEAPRRRRRKRRGKP